MITLIVARAQNGAIGRDGDIPWSLPEDLKTFQRETLGGALIMGRNTWDSLPKKPLPMRLNIVVSSSPDIGEAKAASVSAAVKIASDRGYNRIYGIGGARIYQEMIPIADRLLITEVNLQIKDADTFFPDLQLDHWTQVDERPLRLAEPESLVREYLKLGPRLQIS